LSEKAKQRIFTPNEKDHTISNANNETQLNSSMEQEIYTRRISTIDAPLSNYLFPSTLPSVEQESMMRNCEDMYYKLYN
jgi:hypothetical protein